MTLSNTEIHGSLYTKIDQNIATLLFAHPKGNSLTQSLLERLTKEINRLSTDETVRVLVLASEGKKAFCAGAALHEVLALTDDIDKASVFFEGFANVILAIKNCPKPVIARVQGKSVGGAVGVLSACDAVYATESASIRLSELSIGIAPFVIEPAVSRALGVSGFQQLAWAPTRWKNPYWAQEKGLFHRVFDTVTDLDNALAFYTEELSTYNPQAMQLQKQITWQDTSNWDTLLKERARLTAQTVLSPFCKKSLSRFR